MKGNRVRVLLVDDHAVVRAGYRLLLQNAPEIEVVAEADSGELGCRLFAELTPDVVIMDLTLPGIGGLEAIRRIVQRDSRAKVLVFSMHEDILFVEQALAAGARGYVTKSSAPRVLIAAVKQVAAGGQPLARDIAQRLKVARSRGDSPLKELSTREFEIFCLLAEGLSSADIAKRLSLSHKTVANYGTQLKAKLGVGTVAELTRLAIRHGVVAA
jgi:DNA-binding NarL/FixJ family response regulator